MVAYSFKQRFVQPIRVGLSSVSLSFDCPPKRQTIRAHGKRRHARPGETLQLYRGMRTRQCFKIGDARCTDVKSITIKFDDVVFWIYLERERRLSMAEAEAFARCDGFASVADMQQFWIGEHGYGKFDGVVVEWEPLS